MTTTLSKVKPKARPAKKASAKSTDWSRDRVRKGLCRSCGQKRGQSPYKSRCAKCAERDRAAARKRNGSKAWRPGKPGRPPATGK